MSPATARKCFSLRKLQGSQMLLRWFPLQVGSAQLQRFPLTVGTNEVSPESNFPDLHVTHQFFLRSKKHYF